MSLFGLLRCAESDHRAPIAIALSHAERFLLTLHTGVIE